MDKPSRKSKIKNCIQEIHSITPEFIILASLTIVAGALRFYRVGTFTLWGDEYNSLREANQIGLSYNSIPYFYLLRLAIRLGAKNELWLRFPAILTGTISIPVSYYLGRDILGSRKHGVLFASITLSSAYLLEFSQQVRFYSLFFFSAILSFLIFVDYLNKGYKPGRFIVLVLVNLFCISSMLLGFIVVIVQAITYWLVRRGVNKRKVILLVILLMLVISLPLVLPNNWLDYPFRIIDRLQGDSNPDAFKGSRGIHKTTIVKFPMTFFFFLFGQSVYPLALWLVIPGIIISSYLVVRGIWSLRNTSSVLILLICWLILPPFLLYLGFEAWVPSGFVGTAPKYIIYVIGAIYLLLTQGILSHRPKITNWLIIMVVVFNVICLAHYYFPSWSYSRSLTNWHSVSTFVQSQVNKKEESILLHDGRSNQYIKHYIPSDIRTEYIYNYNNNFDAYEEIVVITNDWHLDRRISFTNILGDIEDEYTYRTSYVDYPLFIYSFQRRSHYDKSKTIGQVNIPKELYGLAFSDLRLPQKIICNGEEVLVNGSFSLPNLQGERFKNITLELNQPIISLCLLSNLVNVENLSFGEPVAIIKITADDNTIFNFVIRNGIETTSWINDSEPDSYSFYKNAYSWHKNIAIVGRSAYNGAYKDSEAHIWSTILPLGEDVLPQTIEIRYLADKGQFYIWGLAFETRQ